MDRDFLIAFTGHTFGPAHINHAFAEAWAHDCRMSLADEHHWAQQARIAEEEHPVDC